MNTAEKLPTNDASKNKPLEPNPVGDIFTGLLIIGGAGMVLSSPICLIYQTFLFLKYGNWPSFNGFSIISHFMNSEAF